MKPLSVKFFLRNDRAKNESSHPLFIRIIYERKKAEIKTSYFLDPKYWDQSKEFYSKRGYSSINEEVTFARNKLFEIKRELDYAESSYDTKRIKNIFLGKEKSKIGILEYFQEFLNRRAELSGEYKKSTISKYNGTFLHLKDFISQTHKAKDINIAQFDTKSIIQFEEYLLSKDYKESKLTKNTVSKHQSRIRTLVIQAKKEGHLSDNPYDNFKITYKKTDRVALDEEELIKITGSDLGQNLSLQRVRDIFMFSVYTGLRFSDAANASVDDIKKDSSGNHYLEIVQEKTGDRTVIPLVLPALGIIEKYQGDDNRLVNNKILPKISNQKVNAYLKVIADLCGINKKLTHHIARHTCATTFLLNNGASFETVKGWLGHNDIKTSQLYGKITLKNLSDFAKKMK